MSCIGINTPTCFNFENTTFVKCQFYDITMSLTVDDQFSSDTSRQFTKIPPATNASPYVSLCNLAFYAYTHLTVCVTIDISFALSTLQSKQDEVNQIVLSGYYQEICMIEYQVS